MDIINSNKILLLFSLLPLMYLTSCGGGNGNYVGDGNVRFLDAPLLGKDGYEITFPEMVIKASNFYEYSVEHFPKKGRYTLLLSLLINDGENRHRSDYINNLYDLLNFEIEIYKNGQIIKQFDSEKDNYRVSIGGGKTGLYFNPNEYKSSEYYEHNSSIIKVKKLDEHVKLMIKFRDYESIDFLLKGNLILKIDGFK